MTPSPAHTCPQSSRIFVKDLPPNLREEDFKKHFSQLAQPTDIRFIPTRRIGYVGYKSPEEASKAVKYFNKSFIRMSKIAVEIAKSFRDVQSRKKLRDSEQQHPFQWNVDAAHLQGNDGLESVRKDVKNAKLHQFLEAMAPSSRSRTWANEDSTGTRAISIQAVYHMKVDDNEGSDMEHQTISRKRKRPSEEEDEGYASSAELPFVSPAEEVIPTSRAELDRDAVDGLRTSFATNYRLVEDGSSTGRYPVDMEAEPAPAISDSDWLRSRTSRLLGLVDDAEYESTRQVQPESQNLSKIDRLEQIGRSRDRQRLATSGAASHTDEDDQVHQKQVTSEGSFAENETKQATASVEAPDTGRLFVRNLSYSATDSELQAYFSAYGVIDEVHISRDTSSGASKGFGYIRFTTKESSTQALIGLDGKTFQGRLLHILPAIPQKERDHYEVSKLSFKKQQQIGKRAEASKAILKWNSLYMNPDAILSSTADQLGLLKSDILDPTSTDAAVIQAHAETKIIQETKTYFTSQGVDLDSFKRKDFCDRTVLLKNFPYNTTAAEIKDLFEAFGIVSRLLMPPSATIAIVEMKHPMQARSAFQSLAYRKFKDSVLFLEKAPKGVLEAHATPKAKQASINEAKVSTSELIDQSQDPDHPVLTSTLFVRNLNFSTTTEELRDLFKPLPGFLSAKIKTKIKTSINKPNEHLSMGFGFVEFRSNASARSALTALNGHSFAGHDLVIRESHKVLDAAEARKKEDDVKKVAGRRTKIVVKNLPFECSTKDLRALIEPYGKVRSVRVPKKFNGSSRGFAFVDLITVKEAENAMKALHGVHLSGRRLNLEFASESSVDPEEEIEEMQKKVGHQAKKDAIQRLSTGRRKIFSLNQGDDLDGMI